MTLPMTQTNKEGSMLSQRKPCYRGFDFFIQDVLSYKVKPILRSDEEKQLM